MLCKYDLILGYVFIRHKVQIASSELAFLLTSYWKLCLVVILIR